MEWPQSLWFVPINYSITCKCLGGEHYRYEPNSAIQSDNTVTWDVIKYIIFLKPEFNANIIFLLKTYILLWCLWMDIAMHDDKFSQCAVLMQGYKGFLFLL